MTKKKQLYSLMAIHSPACMAIRVRAGLRYRLLDKIRVPCRAQLNFDLSDQISSIVAPNVPVRN